MESLFADHPGIWELVRLSGLVYTPNEESLLADHSLKLKHCDMHRSWGALKFKRATCRLVGSWNTQGIFSEFAQILESSLADPLWELECCQLLCSWAATKAFGITIGEQSLGGMILQNTMRFERAQTSESPLAHGCGLWYIATCRDYDAQPKCGIVACRSSLGLEYGRRPFAITTCRQSLEAGAHTIVYF